MHNLWFIKSEKSVKSRVETLNPIRMNWSASRRTCIRQTFASLLTLQKQVLWQHIQRVQIKPFQCNMCGKVFPKNSKLKKHIALAHDGQTIPVQFYSPLWTWIMWSFIVVLHLKLPKHCIESKMRKGRSFEMLPRLWLRIVKEIALKQSLKKRKRISKNFKSATKAIPVFFLQG